MQYFLGEMKPQTKKYTQISILRCSKNQFMPTFYFYGLLPHFYTPGTYLHKIVYWKKYF